MVGSLVYLMLCTRLDVYFTIGMMSRYRFNSRLEHWTKVKHILKYLKRMKDYILMYHCDELIFLGYINSDF